MRNRAVPLKANARRAASIVEYKSIANPSRSKKFTREDWGRCKIAGTGDVPKFEAHGGALNLSEVIEIFSRWVRAQAIPVRGINLPGDFRGGVPLRRDQRSSSKPDDR
jgi:hypothetical protein